MLFKVTGHFAWATGAWTIEQALGPFLGKALHPLSQGRIGKMKSRGGGVDVMALDHGTDGLRAAKDPGLLGLFEHCL
jgi:hypothetical protein